MSEVLGELDDEANAPARILFVSVYDELERVLAAGTWRELAPLLQAGADSETGKETRRWYRERRAYWTKKYEWALVARDPE